MLARKRTLVVMIALALMIVPSYFTLPVHASTSYNSTPNTVLAVDRSGDYNNGHTIGEYGSTTGFDHVEPRTEQTANFYAGDMANTVIGSSSSLGGGVRNLHITMMGIYPDGTRIDGLHMVADQPLEGPNGSAQPDGIESIVRAALGSAFAAYNIPSDILSINLYTQSTPAEYGRDSYDVFADWTCATNNCLNQLGDSYLFPYVSLKDSFHLNVDPNKTGTYFLQFIYHVDFVYCSHTGQYKGQTLCDGWADYAPDYIDNILYCYVVCSSNDASFTSQTANSGAQSAQVLNPSQTTYMDSQLSSTTFNTADPVYVGTYQKTQDSLIGFSLPSLPPNSIVTSANIQLYVSQLALVPPFGSSVCNGPHNQGNPTPCQLLASEISTSWDSSKATWNSPPTTTGSQTTLFFPSIGNLYVDITNLVQAGYANNNFYGIELSPADSTETWQLSIMSGVQRTQGPILTVNYITYTSPPSTMCLGQTASVAITMTNVKIDSNGNVLSLSNWYPASSGIANPFVLESENPEGNTNWGASSIALPQNVLYGQSATFNLNIVAPTVPGTYNFQWRMAQLVNGAAQSFGDYTPNLVVNVSNCFDFTLSASPTSLNIPQTQAGSSTITVTSTGHSGTVTLSASTNAVINGVTYLYWDWSTCNVTDCQASVPLTAGGTATPSINIFAYSNSPPGTYTVTVKGTDQSGTVIHSTSISVTVTSYTITGGGGGGSLAQGTMITMANGSNVAVQNIKTGDQLLGYNPATGTFGVSTVTSVKIVHTSTLLVVHMTDGTTLRTDASATEVLWTRLHDGTSLWLPVTQLQSGDDLWTQNGWVPVTNITSVSTGQHTMYDITATLPYFADGYLDPPHPS